MNNPQLHKNWMVRVNIIVYIIACFAACIPTNEPFDPYLTDRSQDWNVSVIADVTIKPHSLNQTQIEEDAFVKSVLYRDEVPPFKADVSDEEKALVAVKELLTSCYNEQNIWDSMILIDHNYDDTLCLINYCSYYFIFDKQGNLIVSINGDNYPDLRI